MIVDTSALVAIAREEAGREGLRDALLLEDSKLPAPVLVEFARVTSGPGNVPRSDASLLIELIRSEGAEVLSFTGLDAEIAASANVRWGTGNGRGGPLNMLDLMVYAMAKRLDLPILCTGRDFTGTDARIHPASRRD